MADHDEARKVGEVAGALPHPAGGGHISLERRRSRRGPLPTVESMTNDKQTVHRPLDALPVAVAVDARALRS